MLTVTLCKGISFSQRSDIYFCDVLFDRLAKTGLSMAAFTVVFVVAMLDPEVSDVYLLMPFLDTSIVL